MTLQEFQAIAQDLQDTVTIGNDPERRRYFYGLFDDLYLFLETHDWDKENLIEHGEPNVNAHFQNIAEGYYRLGFFEISFFYFSKLAYELWYQKTLIFQESHNERIHKGTQVHQIGIILDHLSEKNLAWDYFLAGITEDIVTGRTMQSSQAFRMLRVLGMSHAELEWFEAKIQENKNIFDPLGYITQIREQSYLSTYDENQSVDLNKLKHAEILWQKVIKKKDQIEKEKEKKENGK